MYRQTPMYLLYWDLVSRYLQADQVFLDLPPVYKGYVWPCKETDKLKRAMTDLGACPPTTLKVFTRNVFWQNTTDSFQGHPYRQSCGERGSWRSLPNTNHTNGHAWRHSSQQCVWMETTTTPQQRGLVLELVLSQAPFRNRLPFSQSLSL